MSDDLTIITNHHERPMIDAYELNSVERAEFDYIDWDAVDEAMDNPTAQTARSTPSTVTSSPAPAAVTLEDAYRLLGVTENATTKQIQAAYDEVATLLDPAKFDENSPARARAEDLLRRLKSAKRTLDDNVDPTVKRFEKLDID